MRFRLSGKVALVFSLAALGSCSGGSTTAGVGNSPTCSGQGINSVCLEACSLGCRGNSCDISNIAQNENVVLRFSQPMDPRFVNTSTIQFRSATGDPPVGDFLVNGTIVEFVPRVLSVGGQSFFGFRSGETYTMTLPGGLGENNAVRSTAGDPLDRTTTCTLQVTRGIVDLNGVPPSARLVQPSAIVDVAQNQVIQIGFNELVDATPFLQSPTGTGPVSFEVARSTDAGDGTRVCGSEYSPLAGQASLQLLPSLPNGIGAMLTFQSTNPLPGSSCIRVTVTDQVRDLSGRAAEIQTFVFQTVVVPTVQQEITEEFSDDAQLDEPISSGTWSGGVGRFATVGGDGRHGRFDVTAPTLLGPLFTLTGPNTYTINTNSATIPADRSHLGVQQIINDGRFFFSDFIVPAGVTLKFIGTVPPQITVRGRLVIDGTIDVQGESVAWVGSTSATMPDPTNVNDPKWLGVTGGRGGIFGGAGGNGGRRSNGLGLSSPAGVENGRNGSNVNVQAGHAYAGQVGGTGGLGGTMFPAHGTTAQVIYPPASLTAAYAMEAAAGAGGAGFTGPGARGIVVRNPVNDPNTGVPPRADFMGPPTNGGGAFSLLPIPANANRALHFLVGGAGGGGSGSQPSLLIQTLASQAQGRIWSAGQGGGGGGGAIALRSGNSIRISAAGKVLASGGSAGSNPTTTPVFAQPSPAGGGSGGSILLQCADAVQVFGELNVLGGNGGQTDITAPGAAPYGGRLTSQGGAGAPGFIRLERPNATIGDLGASRPSPGSDNVGNLTETDNRVAFQSKFYSTNQPFAPEYVRYEIRALVNGQPILFSDDQSVGVPARPGFGPLEVFWQASRMDLSTGEVDAFDPLVRPWRTNVRGQSGLGADARNAFRFLLILDRTLGQTVEIQSLKVIINV